MRSEVRRDTDRISYLRAQVRSLSPQKTLDRGYAVVQLADGSVVRDAAAVEADAQLRIRVAAGELDAVATGHR